MNGGGLIVVEENRTTNAEVDNEVAGREWTVGTPQLGDADRPRQVVVATAVFTGAVGITKGSVHPSGIGSGGVGLD